MERQVDNWLDGFMEYTKELESPKIYRLWVGLSVLAAVAQRKIMLRWGHEIVYPNLYVVLVGPAGARKGTAMRPGQEMLEELGVKLAAESVTREALIQALCDSKEFFQTKTGTIIHCSLTVFNEELAAFLGRQDMNFMATINRWWDNPAYWDYKTKGSGVYEVRNAYVNLLSATTHELLQTQLSPDAIGGGFASRVIFVNAYRKERSVPIPIYNQETELLGKKLTEDLNVLLSLNGSFEASKEYQDLYSDWYIKNDLETPIKFRDANFSGYVNRRARQFQKVSILCALARGTVEKRDDLILTDMDFERAKNIMLVTEAQMKDVFSGVGYGKLKFAYNKIMNAVKVSGTATDDELMELVMLDLDDPKQLDSILATLDRHDDYVLVVNGASKKLRYVGEHKEKKDDSDALKDI